MSAEKVHKSLRLDAGTDDRAHRLQMAGESETALYTRIIEAGIESLESGRENDEKAPGSAEAASPLIDAHTQADSGNQGITEALTSTIETLRDQLEAKDRQIEALEKIAQASQEIAGRSQALQAMGTQTSKRRGLFARLFGKGEQ